MDRVGDHHCIAWLASFVKVIGRRRRRLTGTFGRFAEVVAERLEPIIESEFRSLPDHERIAAIIAVCDTFAHAPA